MSAPITNILIKPSAAGENVENIRVEVKISGRTQTITLGQLAEKLNNIFGTTKFTAPLLQKLEGMNTSGVTKSDLKDGASALDVLLDLYSYSGNGDNVFVEELDAAKNEFKSVLEATPANTADVIAKKIGTVATQDPTTTAPTTSDHFYNADTVATNESLRSWIGIKSVPASEQKTAEAKDILQNFNDKKLSADDINKLMTFNLKTISDNDLKTKLQKLQNLIKFIAGKDSDWVLDKPITDNTKISAIIYTLQFNGILNEQMLLDGFITTSHSTSTEHSLKEYFNISQGENLYMDNIKLFLSDLYLIQEGRKHLYGETIPAAETIEMCLIVDSADGFVRYDPESGTDSALESSSETASLEFDDAKKSSIQIEHISGNIHTAATKAATAVPTTDQLNKSMKTYAADDDNNLTLTGDTYKLIIKAKDKKQAELSFSKREWEAHLEKTKATATTVEGFKKIFSGFIQMRIRVASKKNNASAGVPIPKALKGITADLKVVTIAAPVVDAQAIAEKTPEIKVNAPINLGDKIKVEWSGSGSTTTTKPNEGVYKININGKELSITVDDKGEFEVCPDLNESLIDIAGAGSLAGKEMTIMDLIDPTKEIVKIKFGDDATVAKESTK